MILLLGGPTGRIDGSLGVISTHPMNSESALSVRGPNEVADRFAGFERLTVRQRKRWMEILLSFEFKNSYDVYDDNQEAVLNAREVGAGPLEFFRRVFMGPLRPFEMEVADISSGQVLLRIKRSFRFFFHRIDVRTGSGVLLGAVQRRWSWLRRIYVIEDAQGAEVAELFGPILKPWTFEIRTGGVAKGAIRKKWSGLGKEMFTDADNFGVDLEQVPPQVRALAFAATVLVDVVHFERAKG
jgi:uncharacterized protein YxjI